MNYVKINLYFKNIFDYEKKCDIIALISLYKYPVEKLAKNEPKPAHTVLVGITAHFPSEIGIMNFEAKHAKAPRFPLKTNRKGALLHFLRHTYI